MRALLALSCTCLAAIASTAHSAQSIPSAYRQIAADYGLAPAILYATALTASGRSMSRRGVRPWPWTLRIAGRRHYYPTRASAHRALQAHIARGFDVRVGLMGLSWDRYRAEALNPWAALDPHTNLRLAAARLAPYLAHRAYSKRIRGPVNGDLDKLIAELAPRYALDAKLVRKWWPTNRLLTHAPGVPKGRKD